TVAQPPVALARSRNGGVDGDAWIRLVRGAALGVFLSVTLGAWLAQPLAGRLVWTVTVASLPLLFVLLGFHRWRRICPLALLAQLPQRLGLRPTRKASPWLQANYYLVTLAVFTISLWLR